MREHPNHFITKLRNYSFGNCKRAYHFHHAGLKIREVAKAVWNERPYYKNHQIKEMIQAYTEALEFEALIEAHRQELNETKTPYYDRKFDSWENEIITRASKGKGKDLWYAVLDTRGADNKFGSTSLDFSTCADTRQDAIRFCALKIRLDVLGIGKFAPHGDLQGYVQSFEYAEYWRDKETKRNYRLKKKVPVV
jgi:hypothetical protein